MTSSNFVGNCTGSSAGFAPLRMHPYLYHNSSTFLPRQYQDDSALQFAKAAGASCPVKPHSRSNKAASSASTGASASKTSLALSAVYTPSTVMTMSFSSVNSLRNAISG